ncbi:MAG: lysophospholipase [Ponticaulis sp.]|nr:lysophospholipase [Ponticaulis sp.]|tara:strand:+ start:4907 stop:5335 length:429 start_codon:yes stop_codon:yes gene_type:complete
MIHLVKLCVGAESVSDLEDWQKSRVFDRIARGLDPHPRHETRQMPKRAEELLDGGSLYWVIKGTILVRQRILEVNAHTDHHGKSYCELVFDGELVLTEPQGRKAFQGWRYLTPEDAPPDAPKGNSAKIPEDLGRALREAGVW